MMEPRRLLEQGATDAERALLHSARADGPPKGAAQRMLVALEGLTAGSGSASAAAAAHAIKLGAFAKIGLVAVLGLGALGAGVVVHRMAGQRSVSGEMPPARAPVMQERPVAGKAEIAGAQESQPPEATSEASTPVPGSGSAPRHRQANVTDESLSAEIRILDAARAAVDAHNPAAAQRALDSHAQRFPQGHLKPEAMVLRLAVLVQQGNRAAARSLAAQLLAGESYKAYEYRIRSLLRETGE
jgi:TolA-binding protein